MLMIFFELPSASADGKKFHHKTGFSRISDKSNSLTALAKAIWMLDIFFVWLKPINILSTKPSAEADGKS